MKCSPCYLTSCFCAPIRWLFPCCNPKKVIVREEVKKVDVLAHQVSREQFADALDTPRLHPLEFYSWNVVDVNATGKK